MADEGAKSAKEIAQAYKEANREAQSFTSQLQASVSHLKEGGKYSNFINDNMQSLGDALSDNIAAEEKLNQLMTVTDQLLSDAAKKGITLNKAFLNILQTQTELLQKEVELNNARQEAVDKQKELEDEIDATLSKHSEFYDSFKEYSDLAKDPKMIGVAALGLLAKEIGAVGTASRELVKQLGAVGGQAAEVSGQVATTTAKFRMMGVDAQEAAAAVNSIYMNTTLTGDEMDAAIEKVAVLTEGFGMSAEQAAEMTEQASIAGLNVDDMAISLARARGVAPAKVLANMSGSTEEIARFGKEGAASFVEAAVGDCAAGPAGNCRLAGADHVNHLVCRCHGAAGFVAAGDRRGYLALPVPQC